MDTPIKMNEILQESWKNGWRLGLIAAVCCSLVALAYLYASPIVEKNKADYQLQILKAVLPHGFYDNNILNDTIKVKGLSGTDVLIVHVAKLRGIVQGFVFPVTTEEGYSGPIELVVGIDKNGNLLGVRVVNHQETPGLGDKVDSNKSNWILEFSGKNLENPTENFWKVKKDGGVFDSFTGATITPRAVVKKIKESLLYFKEHQAEWLQESSVQ